MKLVAKIILLIFVFLRIVGSIAVGLLLGISLLSIILFAVSLIYAIALVGIIKNQAWGYITAIVMAGVDLFVLLVSIPSMGLTPNTIGGIVGNLLIILPAIYPLKSLKESS